MDIKGMVVIKMSTDWKKYCRWYTTKGKEYHIYNYKDKDKTKIGTEHIG